MLLMAVTKPCGSKFANTLRLRLLIRQSEIPGFDPTAEIAKIQATGGVLGAGESVNVNPGYVNDVDKQNPYYANYGYTPTGNKATTSINANNYILGILTTSSDPRIGRFFQPAGNGYVGGTYGDKQNNIPLGSQSSYFVPRADRRGSRWRSWRQSRPMDYAIF